MNQRYENDTYTLHTEKEVQKQKNILPFLKFFLYFRSIYI